MRKMINFLDTCSLMKMDDPLPNIYVSVWTLSELENIKSSMKYDENTKYKARKALRWIEENEDKISIYRTTEPFQLKVRDLFPHLLHNMDADIIIDAYLAAEQADDGLTFITEDTLCKWMAKSVGLKVDKIPTKPLDRMINSIECPNDEILSKAYCDIFDEPDVFNPIHNSYLLLKNGKEVIDEYKWNGTSYERLPYIEFFSKMFGKIKPKDKWQACAMDSLVKNQMTVITGRAGSGKTMLSLSFAMQELEKGHIDCITIFCNPVAVKDSARLGFYPGSRDSKLLDSQVGNILSSKLGDITAVERLIDNGCLQLIPLSDARGVDLSRENNIMYITEAQNMSIELMKLALQRCGRSTKIIIEGDLATQVDSPAFGGENNGLRRAIEIFQGSKFFGYVHLPNIHRSEVAKIADQM